MSPIKTRRPAPSRSFLFAALMALLGGCAWSAYTPVGRPITLLEHSPGKFVTLPFDQPLAGELDCDAGFCNQWYRVDVEKSGSLRVRVSLTEDTPDQGPLVRVVLRPLGQPVIAKETSQGGKPIDFRQSVSPDVYGVLVEAGGGHRGYEITVSLE